MTHKRFRQVKFSLRLPRAESAPKLLSGRHRLFRTTVVVLALAVVCLLGALLLSFSAYMCMGSCWYFHANEVVCFSFLLFATEEAVGRGHWSYLVLAVAVVGLLGAFHLYLCALLLCFYVPLRLVDRYSWRPWPIARASVLLAAAAVLGVGLGAIV